MKRRNLSLIKSPSPVKVVVVECDVSFEEPKVEVVTVSSDEESLNNTPPVKSEPGANVFDLTFDSPSSSASTLVLTPQIQQTPQKSDTNKFKPDANVSQATEEPIELPSSSTSTMLLTPPIQQTPQKSNTKKFKPGLNVSQEANASPSSSTSTIIVTPILQTPEKSITKTIRSPGSSNKYYSPNKKRAVYKQSPVKRNLANEWSSSPNVQDEVLVAACEGMDDKTKFMLTTIYNCLSKDGLFSLLSATSQDILQKCFKVTKPGAKAICRMYWRKPQWFREDNFKQLCETVDDPTFRLMANDMVSNGLVSASVNNEGNNYMTFDDYANVLKLDEIKQICKDFKIKVQSKQNAIESLKTFSKRSSISAFFTSKGGPTNNVNRVLNTMRSKVGTCYKLSDQTFQALYELHILMYLGMDYDIIRTKKLELLLINDKINRETYPIDKDMDLDDATVVFNNKDEFYKYLKAHDIYENYLAETDTQTKCNIITEVYNLYKNIPEDDMTRYKSYPVWLHRYTPAYVYIKILASGIQELKKIKINELALDIVTSLINQIAFRQHKKAEWYAEKALILHKLFGLHEEAAKVLIEGFKSNLSCEAKDAMRPRAKTLANQQNITLDVNLRRELLEHTDTQILENKFPSEYINKQPMENDKQRGKKKFRVDTDNGAEYFDCEEYCVYYYTNSGTWTHGKHWEGRIITTIFTLLFWDIIYMKPRGVNGVFLSYFQRHPLDLYFESFYINRKTLIDEWLTCIENMETDKMIEIIKNKWDERPRHEVSGINRDMRWEEVEGVCRCLRARRAAALCRRLAAHYGHCHAGFPDLTLWNLHTGQIKFVEVKTDTDKPSMKQLQWMQYLTDHGIDTGFCYVGVHNVRHKARVPMK